MCVCVYLKRELAHISGLQEAALATAMGILERKADPHPPIFMTVFQISSYVNSLQTFNLLLVKRL